VATHIDTASVLPLVISYFEVGRAMLVDACDNERLFQSVDHLVGEKQYAQYYRNEDRYRV
jgi:hypothetical protein